MTEKTAEGVAMHTRTDWRLICTDNVKASPEALREWARVLDLNPIGQARAEYYVTGQEGFGQLRPADHCIAMCCLTVASVVFDPLKIAYHEAGDMEDWADSILGRVVRAEFISMNDNRGLTFPQIAVSVRELADEIERLQTSRSAP